MARKQTYSMDEVRALLEKDVRAAGTYRAWAAKTGLSPFYACRIVNGKKDASEAFLNALGLEAITIYRKKAQK